MSRILPRLLALCAACALALPGSALAQGKDLKIGFAFSMTGPAAAYGATQKNGAQLAIEELNAKGGPIKIEGVFEDDASTPQQGINVFQKFLNADKVSAIVGPTLSNTAQAADRLAQAQGCVVLAVSNTAPGITEIGDFIFRDSLTEAVVIPNTVKVAKEKTGMKKVVLFYGNDDAYTKGGYLAFKDALTKQGIEIMSEPTFAKGDRDFSPQLTKIKAAAPDALVVSALVEEASGIVAQARQLGLTQPILGGNGFNNPGFIKNAGQAAEGTLIGAAWIVTSPAAKNAAFVEAYTKKFGAAPDQFAAQAYTAVHLLNEAATKAASTDRLAVRNALAGIKDFDTVLGSFSFTPGRDADHTPVVQTVKDGKFVQY